MAYDEDFARAKHEMMTSGPPSDADNLLGMQMDFDVYWDRSRLLRDVTVTPTESPDNMLAVSASAMPEATSEEIERELLRIWREEVRYRYREASTTSFDEAQVRLDGVTQVGPGGFFVTASVTVRRT